MGLIFLIIFSFFAEKHKIQFLQILVLEFHHKKHAYIILTPLNPAVI